MNFLYRLIEVVDMFEYLITYNDIEFGLGKRNLSIVELQYARPQQSVRNQRPGISAFVEHVHTVRIHVRFACQLDDFPGTTAIIQKYRRILPS